MSVEIRTQIGVTLGTPQRHKILADIVMFRIAVDHRSDHEGVVDDLTEAELLGEIVWAIEESDGRRLAGQPRSVYDSALYRLLSNLP